MERRPLFTFSKRMRDSAIWNISSNKFIKLFSGGRKVTFQKVTTKNDTNHQSRGVTISDKIFHHLEDVSIDPSSSVALDKNITLKNCNGKIYLTKYCFSKDDKCCSGGLFIFTMDEWFYFFNTIRWKILEKLRE